MFAETGGIALVLFILLAFEYSRIEGLPRGYEVINDTGQFVGLLRRSLFPAEATLRQSELGDINRPLSE